jgi:hypothetical protein
MDKISCLSYLLYQSDNQEIKDISIQLLNGETSLRDLKKIKALKTHIRATEAKIKKVDTRKVVLFVEEFMLMA